MIYQLEDSPEIQPTAVILPSPLIATLVQPQEQPVRGQKPWFGPPILQADGIVSLTLNHVCVVWCHFHSFQGGRVTGDPAIGCGASEPFNRNSDSN